MQVSIESTQGLERKMTVELPPERFEPQLEKRLKEIAKNMRMDGFRPGKIPMRIIRQRFASQVREEVFGEVIRETYFEALTDQKLHPAGEPKIDLDDSEKKGLKYIATFEVMPQVTLGDLAETVIKQPKAEVVEQDIDQMIERLRQQRTAWNSVDRASQDKDRLTVNFKGTIDGEAFEGGSADDVELILGSASMIKGFESGLVGSSADETRTLELKFPDDYNADNLASKDVTFEVSISKVEEPVLPEINDEFCQAFGIEEGGAEALRKDVSANMARELEERIHTLTKERTMDALLASVELDLPAAMIQSECRSLRERMKTNLASSSNVQPQKIDIPLEVFEDQAKKRVALGLIVAEVVAQNELKVDADRVLKRIKIMADSYDNPQEIIDRYYLDESREQLSQVEALVLEDQVVDWVIERSAIEEEATDFFTLMNKDKESSQ